MEQKPKDEKSFVEQRIAQGYGKDRPYLHGQVIDYIKEYFYNKEKRQVTQRFHHGLDVGCGAGLSTEAQVTSFDFHLREQIRYELAYSFILHSFIRYMESQIFRMNFVRL